MLVDGAKNASFHVCTCGSSAPAAGVAKAGKLATVDCVAPAGRSLWLVPAAPPGHDSVKRTSDARGAAAADAYAYAPSRTAVPSAATYAHSVPAKEPSESAPAAGAAPVSDHDVCQTPPTCARSAGGDENSAAPPRDTE